MDPLTLGMFAAAAIFLLKGKSKKKKTVGPTPTGEDPIPETPDPKPSNDPKPTTPTGGGSVPSDVVGGGWQWPTDGKWNTQGSIAGLLINISNGRYVPGTGWELPGYTITGVSGQQAVKAFQRDWNKLVKHWVLAVSGGNPNVLKKPVGALTADGWIGPKTWTAMRWAWDKDANTAFNWEQAVKAADALS